MERYTEGDIAQRVQEMVKDWAEQTADDRERDELTVGTFALVFELRWPDGGTAISHLCSDLRPWVQAGLFRNAMLNAEDASTDEDE